MKTIQTWQVVGDDRVVGELQDAGRSTGRRVMTSSVVRVVFQGDPPCPFAITTSGSHYQLGAALDKATATAQEFLARKSREGSDDLPRSLHSTEYSPLQ